MGGSLVFSFPDEKLTNDHKIMNIDFRGNNSDSNYNMTN